MVRLRPYWFGLVGLGLALAMPAASWGMVWYVSSVSTLRTACNSAGAGDEIIIYPGTYTISICPYISANNVTIRGSTGNPADVVVRGLGMNVNPGSSTAEGFNLQGDGITIRDLTVAEFWHHAIHFQPGADNIHIDNVITRNNGQQHIKGARPNIGGIIENTLCEQTYVRTNLPSDPRGIDYVGGIDLHGAQNFIIRDCMVKNIMGQGGDADGSIFAWRLCSNITVERCIVTGGNRAICFGNNSGGSEGYDVDGGIIRNCFVYARTAAPVSPDQPWTGNADIGIDLAFVRNVKVYNNTVWTDSGSYHRSLQLYDTSSRRNSNVTIGYNIIRGNINNLSGGGYTAVGNLLGYTPQAEWFVNPANADYHLTREASAAIDQAGVLADVPSDFDGKPRPSGVLPDIGADELLYGDANGDNYVNVGDLQILVAAWASTYTDPNWNYNADFNGDEYINVGDLQVLVANWGI